MDDQHPPAKPASPEWEIVTRSSKNEGTEQTDRLAISGGYLYRTRVGAVAQSVAMVFVPHATLAAFAPLDNLTDLAGAPAERLPQA